MADVSTFIAKLLSSLRESVGNDKFAEIVRQARAYAGGVEKARKRKSPSGSGAGGGGGSRCSEDEPGTEARAVVLSEIKFSEDGKTGVVQIFPKAGTYSHPWYGDLEFDGKFFTDIKTNFDSRIYNQDIPITLNLEHESALSGAVAWFESLDLREDGLGQDHQYTGIWARIQFNDRGASLVADGRYKYFSAEYLPVWTNPETNEVFSNVLTGGALTNHPFFKGMEPVAILSDSRLYAYAEIQPFEDVMETALEYLATHPEASLDEVVAALTQPDEHSDEHGEINRGAGQAEDADESDAQGDAQGHAQASDTDVALSEQDGLGQEEVDRVSTLAAKETAMGMTPEEVQKFNEALAQLTELKAQAAEERKLREAAESKAQAAIEQAAKLAAAEERRQLTETVKSYRAAFKGETDSVVDLLVGLKAKLTDAEWAAYVEQCKENHTAITEGLAFKQMGTQGEGPKPESELDTLVKAKMSEGMKKADAIKAALNERPDLYKRPTERK